MKSAMGKENNSVLRPQTAGSSNITPSYIKPKSSENPVGSGHNNLSPARETPANPEQFTRDSTPKFARSVLRDQSPFALDLNRVQQEMEEISRELEVVKNANIKLKFGFKSAIKDEPKPQSWVKKEVTQEVDAKTREIDTKVKEDKIVLKPGRKVRDQSPPPTSYTKVVPLVKKSCSDEISSDILPNPKREQTKMQKNNVMKPPLPRRNYADIKPMYTVPHEVVEFAPPTPSFKDSYLSKLIQEHAPQKAQIMLEERENKKGELVIVGSVEDESLADCFREHKGDIALKYHHARPRTAQAYKPRTKEEILALRKSMMKSTVRRKDPSEINKSADNILLPSENAFFPQKSIKDLPTKLLERLSAGIKPSVQFFISYLQVDKKEMIKRTRRFYNALPEVLKKKKEEEKKVELIARLKNAKEFEMVFHTS